jgi:hypothetical protein
VAKKKRNAAKRMKVKPIKIKTSLPVVAPVEFHTEWPHNLPQPEVTWEQKGKKLLIKVWHSITG